jgi:hypothetical protein
MWKDMIEATGMAGIGIFLLLSILYCYIKTDKTEKDTILV